MCVCIRLYMSCAYYKYTVRVRACVCVHVTSVVYISGI